jgi:hypothetical protein
MGTSWGLKSAKTVDEELGEEARVVPRNGERPKAGKQAFHFLERRRIGDPHTRKIRFAVCGPRHRRRKVRLTILRPRNSRGGMVEPLSVRRHCGSGAQHEYGGNSKAHVSSYFFCTRAVDGGT